MQSDRVHKKGHKDRKTELFVKEERESSGRKRDGRENAELTSSPYRNMVAHKTAVSQPRQFLKGPEGETKSSFGNAERSSALYV